jgi:hypothetical protein
MNFSVSVVAGVRTVATLEQARGFQKLPRLFAFMAHHPRLIKLLNEKT